MKMPSVMKGGHNFAQVPKAEIPRSQFDRSHGHKSTFDAGYLIPIYYDEALPGDTFNLNMHGFARMATPIKPVMDNFYLETFFFAVPNRLLWENWEKFNGSQTNPGDSTSFVVPTIGGGNAEYTAQSIHDYFGLPLNVDTGGAGYNHAAFWHRAYNLIWNQWFRDENLQNSVTVPVSNGPDSSTLYTLLKRGKRHDYFTSALPFPQKGTAISLPLGTSAPIIPNVANPVPQFKSGGGGTAVVQSLQAKTTGAISDVKVGGGGGAWVANESLQWDQPNLIADLTAATAATINSLRQAFQLQRMLERDARGGTRYTEIIRSHFGVTSPDQRLQRPEYLGGGSAVIIVSPIAQNGATPIAGGGAGTPATPQGNLSGVGTTSWQGHGFAKSFTEHCVLIGLACVRADITYQQGLDRMWSRSTRYDYYWPALSHIGEQSILNKEIYCKADSNDALVFGYQERYGEYRYKQSRITGKFRSTYATTLDIWHASQKFTALPTLNTTFIQESPPMSRLIAVPTEPHFILDSFFSLKCARPMPVFGVPGMVDHF